MCFNYLGESEAEYHRIVDRLNNGKDSRYAPFKCVGKDGDFIAVWDDDNQTEHSPVLMVRGWGHLTGSGAMRLDSDTAKRLQGELIDYCVNKLIEK